MTEQTEMPKTSRLRILLVVSLALNLLIAGLIAGAYLRGHGGHMRDMAAGDGFRALASAMPGEHRRHLGRELFDRRAEFGATREQMNAARAQLAAALVADPFDLDAVSAAFAGQQQILLHIAEEGYKAVIARIAAMTPAERAEYAANLEKRGHK